MSGFDPRTTPARADLAAAHLRGKIEAARFVEGVTKRVASSSAPVRGTGSAIPCCPATIVIPS